MLQDIAFFYSRFCLGYSLIIHGYKDATSAFFIYLFLFKMAINVTLNCNKLLV